MIEMTMNQVKKDFGYKTILNGVDLEINENDRAAIVGSNGSGKTTIFNIFAGLETADSGLVTVRRGASVGFLEQIPALTADGVTVKQVLMDSFSTIIDIEGQMRAVENKMADPSCQSQLDKLMKEYSSLQNKYIALDGYSVDENLYRVVTGFSLEPMLDRAFNNLSGGQKTIVKLAALLLKKPDILFLDEPTNHLDISALEWLEAFLLKYNGTVVVISHDRYFLDKVVNKTILLEDGKCRVFYGNYSFYIKEQEKLLMEEFEAYKNQQKQIAAMKEAIKRFREWGARGDNAKFFIKAKELEKRLEKMEMMDRPKEKASLPMQFNGERSGKNVLSVAELDLILGDTVLFDKAGFDLYFQERVCLFGGNGTGKTSLINTILGKIIPSGGEIRLSESAKIGYIPQEIRFANDDDSVIHTFRQEFIMLEGQARNILAKYFFIGDNVFKKVKMLSGGEKVLLKLAMLVQHKINFLILDEPTNHIDMDTRELLENALLDFNGTLLFVSHDRYFIKKLSQQIVAIEDYKLIKEISRS